MQDGFDGYIAAQRVALQAEAQEILALSPMCAQTPQACAIKT